MVAINQATGKIKWQHHFAHSPYGGATVTNDLVFTTTFDGSIWALNKNTGAVVWHAKLPAGSNSTVAIDGDTVLTGAGFPEGASQKPTFVAYRIGAKGSSQKTSSSGSSSGKSTAVSLTAGRSVFEQNCASCHTLAAAGSSGTVGPNLDQLKPSDALVTHQVTNGGGGMPAFGGQLSKTQIAAVAKYVSTVAGTKKSNPNKGGGGGP
jgi:mono/diheme cytochrome c family protein